jgi:hypothetical protein
MIETVGEWTLNKITAALGVFKRVEVETISVSKGMEMIDSETGDTYCVTMKDGEINKVLGSCEDPVPTEVEAPATSQTIEEVDVPAEEDEVVEDINKSPVIKNEDPSEEASAPIE